MTMHALDRAVFVRDAEVVPSRHHAVMDAQFLVAACQIFLRIAIEVAEGRRWTISAMLARNPSQPPERVLQAFRQRHKTLATEHHMRVLPARKRKPEVIEPMIEALTGDHDAEIAHVGKVGQTELRTG